MTLFCSRFALAPFFLTALLGISLQPANAQVTEYTSRSSFDASSTITSTESFSGIAPAGGFLSLQPANSVDLDGFSFVQASNAPNNDLSIISGSYYGTIGTAGYNLGSGDFLQAGYGSPAQLKIFLPRGTTAFGLDLGTFAGSDGQVTALLSDGTRFVFGNSFSNVSFFGFTSAGAITSLTLMDKADGASNNSLNIDTLEAGHVAAVPEASPTVSFGMLLVLGLGGLAVAKKRKQSAASA